MPSLEFLLNCNQLSPNEYQTKALLWGCLDSLESALFDSILMGEVDLVIGSDIFFHHDGELLAIYPT
jgi:hypothetical protein